MTATNSAPNDATSGANFHAGAAQAAREVGAALGAMAPDSADRLCDEILAARRIACHGVGREGLMMRALAMRLFHLGLDAHVVGDMTTPPLGPGDLLIASAGPGRLPTVAAFVGVAQRAGARALVVTAQPDGETSRLADALIHIPAQTMADDQGNAGGGVGLLPMGSLFEAAQLLFFDLVTILLRERTGQSPDQLRARHTNLE